LMVIARPARACPEACSPDTMTATETTLVNALQVMRSPAEEWPAVRRAGPRNGSQDRHKGKREENCSEPVPPAVVAGLVDSCAADVSQGNSNHHPKHVLDGPEPERRVFHRPSEIVKGRTRDGAEREVQEQSDQHLQIQAHREPEPCTFVGGSPRPLPPPARNAAYDGKETRQQNNKPEPGVEYQDDWVHLEHFMLRFPTARGVSLANPSRVLLLLAIGGIREE
jgi:hypothetical protein